MQYLIIRNSKKNKTENKREEIINKIIQENF